MEDVIGYVALMAWAIGHPLAVVISWSGNASILWGALHGVLGWFYVGYYAWPWF